MNPATVSKAYRRLTESGHLEVRRGEGTFVAATPPTLDPKERQAQLEHAARQFLQETRRLGASKTDTLKLIERSWQTETEEGSAT